MTVRLHCETANKHGAGWRSTRALLMLQMVPAMSGRRRYKHLPCSAQQPVLGQWIGISLLPQCIACRLDGCQEALVRRHLQSAHRPLYTLYPIYECICDIINSHVSQIPRKAPRSVFWTGPLPQWDLPGCFIQSNPLKGLQ